MSTTLSPHHEAIIAQAIATGQFASPEEAIDEAMRLLSQPRENGSTAHDSILPASQWLAEFNRLTATFTEGNPHMDDSRDSIYGDRGL